MKKIFVFNRKGGVGKTTLCVCLAETLKDSRIIDVDNQKNITMAADVTGRNKPVDASHYSSSYLIFDTPACEDAVVLDMVVREADMIIVPALLGYPDMLGMTGTEEFLAKNNLLSKTYVVFNSVRQPKNNSYKEIKEAYFFNYPNLRVAKTELTQLRGFQDVIPKGIRGKAKKEIENLIAELNI